MKGNNMAHLTAIYSGSGNSSHQRSYSHTVTILEGHISDHTLIEIDGLTFERHIAEKAGSKYQCNNCDMSSESEYNKYCSPTHRCWTGANIMINGRDGRVETHGKTMHHIYWKQVVPDPVNRIDITQVDI